MRMPQSTVDFPNKYLLGVVSIGQVVSISSYRGLCKGQGVSWTTHVCTFMFENTAKSVDERLYHDMSFDISNHFPIDLGTLFSSFLLYYAHFNAKKSKYRLIEGLSDYVKPLIQSTTSQPPTTRWVAVASQDRVWPRKIQFTERG